MIGIIGWAQRHVEESEAEADIPEIASASVGRMKGSFLKPPTILVQRRDGSLLEFGIASSRLSPNIAKSNVTTRDTFLKSMQATLP